MITLDKMECFWINRYSENGGRGRFSLFGNYEEAKADLQREPGVLKKQTTRSFEMKIGCLDVCVRWITHKQIAGVK